MFGGALFKIVGRVAYPVLEGAGSFVMQRITRELAESRIGHIIYGKLDDLGRPKGIRAYITPDMITRKGNSGPGSDAADWIKPPGFAGGEANQVRGHLLAKLLGGSGKEKKNLVTLIHNPVNTPIMRGFEDQIARRVEAGELIEYFAIPQYIGDNVIPDSIKTHSTGRSRFSPRGSNPQCSNGRLRWR